jgi:hypothetical protein
MRILWRKSVMFSLLLCIALGVTVYRVSAQTVISPGEARVDTLEGMPHEWEFQGTADTFVEIQMISNEFDPYLELFDSSGILLEDDISSGGNTNARIIFQLPVDGLYRVIARGATQDQGTYLLTLQEGRMNVNSNLITSEEIWYFNSIEGPDSVQVTFTSDDFVGCLELRDSNNNLIARIDASATSEAVTIEYTPTTTGVIQIVVCSHDMGQGEYQLQADVPIYPPMPDNCTFKVEGQGWHASGGTGGLEIGALSPGNELANYAELATQITQFVPQSGNGAVAVLVLDDFAGDLPYSVLHNVRPGTDPLSLDIAHGEMVYFHLTHLLEVLDVLGTLPLNRITARESSSSVSEIDWEIKDGAILTVRKLPLPDYNTSEIALSVGSVVSSLKAQNFGRLVFNLSFSILPCTTSEAYRDYISTHPGASLRDYYNNVVAPAEPILSFEEWLSRELAKVRNDPLLLLMEDLVDGDEGLYYTENTVFVASAGNEPDLNFALFPSTWATVIGVSALNGDGSIWTGSSLGDVIFPGAWFQYPYSVGENVYYAGTSFAAPVMSIIAALRLTTAANACPFDTAPPSFANGSYSSLTDIPLFDSVLNTSGC